MQEVKISENTNSVITSIIEELIENFKKNEKVDCIFYTTFLSSDFEHRQKGNYMPTIQLWIVSNEQINLADLEKLNMDLSLLKHSLEVCQNIKIAIMGYQGVISPKVKDTMHLELRKGTILFDRKEEFTKLQEEFLLDKMDREIPNAIEFEPPLKLAKVKKEEQV